MTARSSALDRAHARALAAYEQAMTRRGLAASTIAVRRRVLRRFLVSLRGTPLRRLRTADLERYLAAQTVSPATLAETARAVCLFLAALVEEGVLREAPRLVLPRVHRPPGLVLSEAGVARLLASAVKDARQPAAALRDRAALELLYGLGLRAGEAAAALLVDLDLERGTLLARRVKRGKDRLLPLPPASIPHLRAYLVGARPVLVRRSGGLDEGRLLLSVRGAPLQSRTVGDLVGRVAGRAGLEAHAHALRRSVATHLARAGAPLPVIQAQLGHERLDSTAVYVRVEEQDLRAAVAVLERRGEGTGPRACSPTWPAPQPTSSRSSRSSRASAPASGPGRSAGRGTGPG